MFPGVFFLLFWFFAGIFRIDFWMLLKLVRLSDWVDNLFYFLIIYLFFIFHFIFCSQSLFPRVDREINQRMIWTWKICSEIEVIILATLIQSASSSGGRIYRKFTMSPIDAQKILGQMLCAFPCMWGSVYSAEGERELGEIRSEMRTDEKRPRKE